MGVTNSWVMEMKSHVTLGFTWCNPRCNTLYKGYQAHQKSVTRSNIEGKPISKCDILSQSLFQEHLVLCETFEASHLGC